MSKEFSIENGNGLNNGKHPSFGSKEFEINKTYRSTEDALATELEGLYSRRKKLQIEADNLDSQIALLEKIRGSVLTPKEKSADVQ